MELQDSVREQVAPRRSLLRRPLTWVAAAGLVLLALVIAFLVWALTPLGPGEESLSAIEGGDGVVVTETGDGWVFAPAGAEPTTGLVFYPGGHVDARSYAPLARDLAALGHVVVIVRMPLSLAVFDPNAADYVIAAPEVGSVGRWAVGGHSLGGAMAAQYLSDTPPDEVEGLLLLAAYASGSADLSHSGLAVADVTASLDAVLDRENWSAGQDLLPPDVTSTVIEGGNHAQFGDYGPQPGDAPATIDPQTQRRLTVEAADRLLDGF